MTKLIKQYKAIYHQKVEIIDFLPFQAASINVVLKEGGLKLQDAKTLISKWNEPGHIKFELVLADEK